MVTLSVLGEGPSVPLCPIPATGTLSSGGPPLPPVPLEDPRGPAAPFSAHSNKPLDTSPESPVNIGLSLESGVETSKSSSPSRKKKEADPFEGGLAKPDMAPSGRGRRRRKNSQRRWCPPCRKKAKKLTEDPKAATKKKACKPVASNLDTDDGLIPSGCCTPKDERFRIPKCTSCPPAPMKRRPAATGGHCSPQRRPAISFFTPPDLELFFCLRAKVKGGAMGGIFVLDSKISPPMNSTFRGPFYQWNQSSFFFHHTHMYTHTPLLFLVLSLLPFLSPFYF
ncbi:hypothetical protein Taro_047237 [Colocasia esculenta]|uniref:Uncharacterized protein n=1 Tax=Colocasia esculenta TaxID=4460 RepID=A0A843X0L1_COLES|nr:hypothetical protein [Colocasia esculenta]